VPPNTFLLGVMHALVFLYINQYTKFEVPSFTNYKDIIGAKFKKNNHVNLVTPLFWVVCHDMIQSTCVQNLTILASAVLNISLGASKHKVG